MKYIQIYKNTKLHNLCRQLLCQSSNLQWLTPSCVQAKVLPHVRFQCILSRPPTNVGGDKTSWNPVRGVMA